MWVSGSFPTKSLRRKSFLLLFATQCSALVVQLHAIDRRSRVLYSAGKTLVDDDEFAFVSQTRLAAYIVTLYLFLNGLFFPVTAAVSRPVSIIIIIMASCCHPEPYMFFPFLLSHEAEAEAEAGVTLNVDSFLYHTSSLLFHLP